MNQLKKIDQFRKHFNKINEEKSDQFLMVIFKWKILNVNTICYFLIENILFFKSSNLPLLPYSIV